MITDRKKEAITRILLKNVEQPYTVIIDDIGVKVFKESYLVEYAAWCIMDDPIVFRNIFRLITNWYNKNNIFSSNSFDEYD